MEIFDQVYWKKSGGGRRCGVGGRTRLKIEGCEQMYIVDHEHGLVYMWTKSDTFLT